VVFVLQALVLVVIVTLMLVVAAPLLAGWLTTRRPGLLQALRVVVAGGVGLLSLVTALVGAGNSSLVLLVIALMVAMWPRGLTGGVRLRTDRLGRRPERIDPSTLGGIWYRLMRDALAARSQYKAAVRRAPRGAIRERLADLAGEVDLALSHAWARAKRGAALERAGAEIDAATRSSRRAVQRWGRGWMVPPEDARVVEAQRARDAAARRLSIAIGEERAQLQVLVARLGEAACSAAELSIAGLPAPPLGDAALAGELVERLDALRWALTEAAAVGEAA
jgi:hypothetical protein